MKWSIFLVIIVFSLFCVSFLFGDDMMEFSVQWRISNNAVSNLEIIPYSGGGQFAKDGDGNSIKALSSNGNGNDEVCRAHYTTNIRGTHVLRFHASALVCQERDVSFGYRLFLFENAGANPAELVVESSSTLNDNSTYRDIALYISEIGIAERFIFVEASLDDYEQMSVGNYRGTIKVEVITN